MSNSHNNNTKRKKGWNVLEPVKKPLTNMKGRVSFDPEKFDLQIKQHGTDVKVFRSMYCPNIKSIDGAEHNVDCTLCNGSGFLDLAPICTKAFIQNQSLEKRQASEGFVDSNTVAMTFLTGIELQYFTKIEVLDETDIYFQRVARSEGNVDHLQYKALRVNVIADSSGKQYQQGTDFDLSVDGHVKWKVGRGPVKDVIYSIHYEAPIQFRAVSAMHSNRFGQIVDKTDGSIKNFKFNEQWQCSKEFLVRRTGINGQEILANPIPGYDEGMDDT